ncbi:MAG: hypothetical protein AB4426_23780 [Xenococcaceae cyanobacterium]
MEKLTISSISKADLKRFVKIKDRGIDNYEWLSVNSIALSENEHQQLENIKSHLLNYDTHLMNEATIWSRGIYPFLLLAEQGKIQAWSQVTLQAKYPNFEIEGVADGVLGKCVSGFVDVPYLVVVEAKRGLEAQNPLHQLYGQLLAAAHLNWEDDGNEPEEIYGCYTIADIWKFMRAEIEGIESDMPTMRLESSREYGSKLEAETIFRILKRIVAKYVSEEE